MGYSVAAGATGRLLFGYDSFGNVCGKKNSPVEGAPLSGQDMTQKKHVFFMNSCNLEVKDVRLSSTVLCVSSCPEEQLDTLEEVQLFANTSGGYQRMGSLFSLRLGIMAGKSFPLFNRCIPQTPECYSLFASVLINDVDSLHRILSGIMSGRDTVLGLCILAFVLLILIYVLRKRIKLAVELLQVTNKAISSSPFLLLQPLWTFAILIFFWVLWVAVLLSLGTAGKGRAAQVIEGGQVEYKPLSGIRYMWWYHLIGLIWTSEFILACQQMTVAGTVVTCYFNRNKSDPPDRPILSSLSILFCYHQGTVVKGSFLITVVRIPRAVLMYVYNTLKEKVRQHIKTECALCLAHHVFNYCLLFQNAYTTTAINGTDFCTSAKDALTLLSKNSSHFTSVNCFGDFIIFLGKVLVVCFTVFGGLMAFNYHRVLQVWAIPLLLVAFFAYLVAHSFLSVFETVLDALFLCFAVDLETNDGSSEKPYFMDQEFL
ncbi:hypothetical protein MJT46_019300, partial [Ovis ammon polii x Ovis aries]